MEQKTGLNELEQESIRAYIEYLVRGGLPDDMIKFFLDARYVPNPSQIEFHRATLECKPGSVQEILMEGPKGGGKSYAELMQAAYDCMTHDGIICLFMRKQKGSARDHMTELATAFKNIPHKLDKNQVTFPNGSCIKVGGYNTSGDIIKYNGQNLSLLIYDELTMIKQDDYDQMWGNLRLSAGGYYPRMYASTNPGGIGHVWVKKKFIEAKREGREKDTRCIHSDTTDNNAPGMGESYKEDKLSKLSGQLRSLINRKIGIKPKLFGNRERRNGRLFGIHLYGDAERLKERSAAYIIN